MLDKPTRTRRAVARELYDARRKVEQLERSVQHTFRQETAELSEKLLVSARRKVARLEVELATIPEEEYNHKTGRRWEGTPPPPWPASVHETMAAGLPREGFDFPPIPAFLRRN